MSYISNSFWRDKYDQHVYNVGDVFPHEDSPVETFKQERIDYLLGRGRIKEVEEEEVTEEVEETEAVNLEALTNDALKDILDARNIDYPDRAKKAELIALIQG